MTFQFNNPATARMLESYKFDNPYKYTYIHRIQTSIKKQKKKLAGKHYMIRIKFSISADLEVI